MTSLWANQYAIGAQKILEMFPFLDRGAESENRRWITHLAEVAMTLRSNKRQLFEALVSDVEEDSVLIQTLWSLLASVSPQEIFLRGSISPLVLKEAFERLLGTKSVQVDLGGFAGFADQGQKPAKWAQLLSASLVARRSIDSSGLSAVCFKTFTGAVFPGILFSSFYHLGTSCFNGFYLLKPIISGFPDGFLFS